MMSATWRVVLLVSVAGLVAVPAAIAGRAWDTGAAISGELEWKVLEIAITADPQDPVTDTMSCAMAEDTDHWVDGDQSEPQEAWPGDTLAGWSPGGCWWQCAGGSVTQGSWTTTWTSPADWGHYDLACRIDDLPQAIPPGDSGSRDDGPHYAATSGWAGGSGCSVPAVGAMQAGDEPPPAKAVWVCYDLLCDGESVIGTSDAGPPLHFPIGWGEIGVCSTVKPHWEPWFDGGPDAFPPPLTYPVWGWFKKFEVVGHVVPVPETPDFQWYKFVTGTARQDGAFLPGPDGQPMDDFVTWHADQSGPEWQSSDPDDDGQIYQVDGPGPTVRVSFEEYHERNETFWCYVTYKGRIPGPLGYGICFPWQVRLEKDEQGNPYAVNWGDYAQ